MLSLLAMVKCTSELLRSKLQGVPGRIAALGLHPGEDIAGDWANRGLSPDYLPVARFSWIRFRWFRVDLYCSSKVSVEWKGACRLCAIAVAGLIPMGPAIVARRSHRRTIG